MSFAVIQTGGKQYKVSASEILKIERLESKEGKTVEFKNVLFLKDDKITEIGNPNIQGAKVEATILKNTKILLKNLTLKLPFHWTNIFFSFDPIRIIFRKFSL